MLQSDDCSLMSVPSLRPTGRRRLTEAQMQATAGLTGCFAPTSPGLVLAAFKAAAPALRFPGSLVLLIDNLMRYTRPGDWQGDWPPMVWPSNTELADRLGLEIGRIKQLVRAALDAGLILARDHGTRKRFGKRGEGGRILYAYGFDLSPLAEKMAQFQHAAAEYQASIEEGRALRREISRLRVAILSMADLGAAQEVPSSDWVAIAAQARETASSARTERDPLRLAPIAARLSRLYATAEAALAVVFPVETNPAGAENYPHNTATNETSISMEIAKDADRPAQQEGSRQNQSFLNLASKESVWRGFPMTPAIALQIAPAFRDLVTTARPNWGHVTEAAHYICGRLGISQHAYGQACAVLGRAEAATAIAVIAAKQDAGLVRSPGGLLRHMVEAHRIGTLRLDRTLFGLVDVAGGLGRTRRGYLATVATAG